MARYIGVAAALHDVGKVFINKTIIRKAGSLTPTEFEEVKLHTIYGYDILSRMGGKVGKIAALVALMHHEHIDGQGYWGIRSSTLPLFVGIVAICDVYCALINRRVYKEAWSSKDALTHIKGLAGSQFCPHLVERFLGMFGNTH